MSLTFSIQDDSIRNPTGLKLLGSSDASTWNLCATYTNSGWNTNATETIVFTDTADYSYYRMVVSQTTKYHFTLAGVKLQAYDYDTTNLSSFPHTYTSSATKDAAYVNMYEWMLEHFQMYTIDSSLNPCDDYIVKEEYYFAPYYDQTDTKSFYQTPTTTSINDAFALYRPKYSSTPQKMINERFAQGRYAGFSVTYESRNRGATDYLVITGNRSTLCDRDHKLFSWRPCHQLYDFTTTGGTVTNKVTNSDVVEETTATINKRFECGVLTGIGVTDAGSGYTNSNLSSSCVHMGNGCENILTGVGNKQIWQKALSAVNAAGNVVAGNIGGVYYTSPDLPFTVSSNTLVDANPVFSVVMANSTSVSYEEIGSTKTTLKRSADFMLNFVLDTSNTDTLYFDESVVQQRKPQRRQHHSVVDDARQNRF
jgi:hypothetical protein